MSSTFSWTFPSVTNLQTTGAQAQQELLLGKDILFNGDFQVTAAGDYVLLSGLDAMRQAIYTRLITRQGEYRARPEYGVGVADFVKKRATLSTLDELRQNIVDQLSLDTRISQVREVVVERIDDGIKVGVVVEVNGETLKFRPFEFRETELIGTIGGTIGVGGYRA